MRAQRLQHSYRLLQLLPCARTRPQSFFRYKFFVNCIVLCSSLLSKNRASKCALNKAAPDVSVHSSRSLTKLKLVLTYNRNDSDATRGNKLVNMKSREVAMKNVQTYRAMSSICRQRAVFDPQNSWKHLGDAERWDHLAHVEIASHFRECNATGSTDIATSGASSNPSDTRWETIAAA